MVDSIKTDIYTYLHIENGASTAEIAELVGVSRNTVIQLLRRKGVLRQAPGRAIEKMVAEYLRTRGKQVVEQRGDAPFDLLVNGKRIDVKSAHLQHEGTYSRYKFELVHAKRKFPRPHQEEVDELYLVFTDAPMMPVHAVDIRDLPETMCDLTIHLNRSCKYPMRLIGYLAERR